VLSEPAQTRGSGVDPEATLSPWKDVDLSARAVEPMVPSPNNDKFVITTMPQDEAYLRQGKSTKLGAKTQAKCSRNLLKKKPTQPGSSATDEGPSHSCANLVKPIDRWAGKLALRPVCPWST